MGQRGLWVFKCLTQAVPLSASPPAHGRGRGHGREESDEGTLPPALISLFQESQANLCRTPEAFLGAGFLRRVGDPQVDI